MTLAQAKLATAAGLALLAWLLRPKPTVGRRITELLIDANVYSDGWGQTLVEPAPSAEVENAIAASSAAIHAFDAAHPEVNTFLDNY